jgi:hypothetical protein
VAVNALTAVDLPVICVETQHICSIADGIYEALLTAQCGGIGQLMRVRLFKPVHVKTLVAQQWACLDADPAVAHAGRGQNRPGSCHG